jgi:putative transposase
MRYRRSSVAGGTFFFTVNLADRSSRLLTDHIELLRGSVRKVRQSYPFEVMAMVVLPDHLHAVWRLPRTDCDYPLRWSLVKAGFSRALEKTERIGASREQKRERGIWQRRYWEHQIRDDADLARHVDYIHINPVKHGYVKTPTDWRYSSIHRYIRQGLLPGDWAAGMNEPDTTGFGERL